MRPPGGVASRSFLLIPLILCLVGCRQPQLADRCAGLLERHAAHYAALRSHYLERVADYRREFEAAAAGLPGPDDPRVGMLRLRFRAIQTSLVRSAWDREAIAFALEHAVEVRPCLLAAVRRGGPSARSLPAYLRDLLMEGGEEALTLDLARDERESLFWQQELERWQAAYREGRHDYRPPPRDFIPYRFYEDESRARLERLLDVDRPVPAGR